jgi:hypothetical protein
MVNPTNARDVLSAATLFGLSDLASYAYDICKQSINVESIVSWVEWCESQQHQPRFQSAAVVGGRGGGSGGSSGGTPQPFGYANGVGGFPLSPSGSEAGGDGVNWAMAGEAAGRGEVTSRLRLDV